jgi:hypothetical protein
MAFVYGETVFQDLIKKYPTWKELESYLESEEGGLFRIVDKKDNLCIIRYDKSISSSKQELPHYRWFRSVVWDMNQNCPLSIAPPKTSSSEIPYNTMNDAIHNGIHFEELLDGFMINCFRRVGDPKVYITTRSKLDAAGHFYSSKSFHTLFMESYLQNIDHNDRTELQLTNSLLKTIWDPNPEMGEQSVSYSFLVRHSDHRVVSPISKNSVHLIQKTVLLDNGYMTIEEPYINNNYIMTDDEKTMKVKDWMKYKCNENSWEFQGFVCKDGKGNRWRFRSDKYMAVKSLRGNNPSPIDRFSQLFLQNLTYKYLEYYPEDEQIFLTCYQYLFYHIMNDLFWAYQAVHCMKSKSIDEIDKKYHPHLYVLHHIYLTQLRPNYKKITFQDITNYIYKLPWQRLSFLLLK